MNLWMKCMRWDIYKIYEGVKMELLNKLVWTILFSIVCFKLDIWEKSLVIFVEK